MNANEPTDLVKIYQQQLKAADILIRQQQTEIEALKDSSYEKGFIDGMAKMTESAVHLAVEGMATIALTEEEVMAKYCTCYKLGYSALNNYTKVEDELLTKGEVK